MVVYELPSLMLTAALTSLEVPLIVNASSVTWEAPAKATMPRSLSVLLPVITTASRLPLSPLMVIAFAAEAPATFPIATVSA